MDDDLTLVREYLLRRARHLKEEAGERDTRAGKAAVLLAHEFILKAYASITGKDIERVLAGRINDVND